MKKTNINNIIWGVVTIMVVTISLFLLHYSINGECAVITDYILMNETGELAKCTEYNCSLLFEGGFCNIEENLCMVTAKKCIKIPDIDDDARILICEAKGKTWDAELKKCVLN